MIRISDLYKSYGKTRVLHQLNVEMQKGQVVGIVGPNGSGKTTLIKCILGLTAVTKGNIYFNNEIISKPGASAYRSAFGYMPQIGRYPENMQIKQLFSMLQDIRGNGNESYDTELIDLYRLREIETKTLGSLSGGTVQKVSAAIAFMFKPQVLILDEPTAGLDPVASEILKDKILKESADRLVIITSHISNDLDELASHLLFLHEGHIRFFDNIANLKNTHEESRLGKIIYHLMEGPVQATQNGI